MQQAYNFKLVPAHVEDRLVVENLARFYLYDVSRYCAIAETTFSWAFPSNGLYNCAYAKKFWDNPTTHAFVIHIHNELGGFAIVNKTPIGTNVDWNMCEFFIVAKFQSKGIGKKVAYALFAQFPGRWEISYLPSNKPAEMFWKRVVTDYTQNNYTHSHERKPSNPKPYNMEILRFNTRGNATCS